MHAFLRQKKPAWNSSHAKKGAADSKSLSLQNKNPKPTRLLSHFYN